MAFKLFWEVCTYKPEKSALFVHDVLLNILDKL